MYDIIIKNGTVVDGTGSPRFAADVAVSGGKIVKIAPEIKGEGQVIDATGLIVAPGFIDGHTHSDSSVLGGTDSYNHLEQGTTTQIAGQCGSSPAPAYSGGAKREYASEEQAAIAQKACATPKSFIEYADTVPLGCNMAFYAGHGALRGYAMGYSDAKAGEAEMAKMKDMLTNAMEAGYLGFSSGLVYAPSVYAGEEELSELCRHMARWNGVYTTHMRGEGDKVEQSVAEAIRTAEKGGVTLVISHLKICGQKNAGKSKTVLKMIEDAVARGMKIHADQYPFNAGSAPLSAQIPPKYIVGGIPELLKKLESPEMRAKMEYSIFNETDEFESLIYAAGWDGVLISGSGKTPDYVGKTIPQIAQLLGKSNMDAMAHILLENECRVQGIYFVAVEEDMLNIMKHPLLTSGSDWSDFGQHFDTEKVAGAHPRGTATMTRRLELCRDMGLRTLEDCVRSMTGLTAESVGIPGQGVLAEGRDANITIFDWDNVKAHADYIHPFRRNEGIDTVIVNGVIAVSAGKANGKCAGRVIRRGE